MRPRCARWDFRRPQDVHERPDRRLGVLARQVADLGDDFRPASRVSALPRPERPAAHAMLRCSQRCPFPAGDSRVITGAPAPARDSPPSGPARRGMGAANLCRLPPFSLAGHCMPLAKRWKTRAGEVNLSWRRGGRGFNSLQLHHIYQGVPRDVRSDASSYCSLTTFRCKSLFGEWAYRWAFSWCTGRKRWRAGLSSGRRLVGAIDQQADVVGDDAPARPALASTEAPITASIQAVTAFEDTYASF